MTGRTQNEFRRRIYSEFVPLEELKDPLLRSLAARNIQLLVAVTEENVQELGPLLTRTSQAELSVGLWPLLNHRLGRWLNAANVNAFARWLRYVVSGDRVKDKVKTIVFDLEPSIDTVKRTLSERRVLSLVQERRPTGEPQEQAALVEEIRTLGFEAFAAVVPLTTIGGRAGVGWERILNTPLSEMRFDRVSAMLYTSLFEGYGWPWVRRQDAEGLLYLLSRAVREEFQERAAASVGAVSRGAIGDEQVYRHPNELRRDVAICCGQGIKDITLFDLGGVLSRPPIEPWLDALLSCDLDTVRPTRRSRAIVRTGRGVGWLAERITATHHLGLRRT